MADTYTNKTEEDLQRRIESIYREAEDDIEKKMDSFVSKYKAKESIYTEKVKSGEISQNDFDAWKAGQVFQGKQWAAKRKQIQKIIANSNQVAVGMINKTTPPVFAGGANFMAYSMENGAGVNFGFVLCDMQTVERLIKDDPKILPEWKIDEPKDYAWNERKLNNAITQGVIQGEKLDQISKRVAQSLSTQNGNTMKTFARTAMTGAQNAGAMYSMREAVDLGIDVEKEWMATFDSHTRDSHADIDGETVPIDEEFSNECMYPGDPGGPPAEVYNCRCTMVANLKKYPSKYERYDNIDGRPVSSMTYDEWCEAKGISRSSRPEVIIDTFQTKLGRVNAVAEVNDLINSRGWWQKEWNPFEGVYDGPEQQADLTGCDLDSARSIAASYEQIFEKYPKLKGRFDPPDAHPRGMKENTYAWCHNRTGRVEVNPVKYKDWTSVVKSYENDVQSGWHCYGTTAESIVAHEVGHAIDGLLARKGILGGVAADGSYRYASSTLKNTIMKRAAKLNEEIADDMLLDKQWNENEAVKKHVSEYATKNNREWFAECFAEYITSANPRTVATEFGKELEKLLEKLK